MQAQGAWAVSALPLIQGQMIHATSYRPWRPTARCGLTWTIINSRAKVNALRKPNRSSLKEFRGFQKKMKGRTFKTCEWFTTIYKSYSCWRYFGSVCGIRRLLPLIGQLVFEHCLRPCVQVRNTHTLFYSWEKNYFLFQSGNGGSRICRFVTLCIGRGVLAVMKLCSPAPLLVL